MDFEWVETRQQTFLSVDQSSPIFLLNMGRITVDQLVFRSTPVSKIFVVKAWSCPKLC